MTAAPDGAVLGVDIGGTTVSLDLVDLEGRSLHTASCPTGRGEQVLETVLSEISAAQGVALEAQVELLGVGLLSPGHVDEAGGVVRFASNLGWRDVDLRARVRSILAGRSTAGTGTADGPADPAIVGTATAGRAPVSLGHDVRWAGIAEGALGAARGHDNYALVSIGTGIAACLVSGGHVLTGAAGSAGEFGHATVFPAGDRCACGRTGCVDAYFSGAGLARRYRELGGAQHLSDVGALLASLPDDEVAARVWDEGLEALARGLCSLTLTVDPGTIVVAGGLSRAGEALIGPLRERLEAQLVWKSAPRLAISPLGDRTGRAGAVMLALTAAGQHVRSADWDPNVVDGWPRAANRQEAPA